MWVDAEMNVLAIVLVLELTLVHIQKQKKVAEEITTTALIGNFDGERLRPPLAPLQYLYPYS